MEKTSPALPAFLALVPAPPDVDRPATPEHAAPPAPARPETAANGEAEAPPDDLPLVIESLLLVSAEPPTIAALARATDATAAQVEAAVGELGRRQQRSGVRLQRLGATVRLVSAPQAAPFVERFLGLERPNRLSRPALETLAIIAYHQPIARTDIDAIRGVNCDGALQTLRMRELIEPVGQADGPGRPFLYGTTFRFLEHFGLQTPDELPPLPEMSAVSAPGRLPLNGATDRRPEAPDDPDCDPAPAEELSGVAAGGGD